MRRVAVVTLMLILVAGALAPAEAAKKPVKTTLYLHGNYPLGEMDGIDWFANGTPPMAMDAREPSEEIPKSMVMNVPGLNTQCTGLPLGFPTWLGNMNGTIVGDAVLTLNVVTSPILLTARLWVDTPVFLCNDGYVQPNSEVTVEVPPGSNVVEVKFPKLRLRAQSLVMIEILGLGVPRGRVFYDATGFASALSFRCIPGSGSRCAPK